jgi:hypothetical protein
MSVSQSLSGVRLVPVELEVGRKTPTEPTKALQRLFSPGRSCHHEFPRTRDADFNLIAFFQLQRLDNRGGWANGETIAPSQDSHDILYKYICLMYISGSHTQRKMCSRFSIAVAGLDTDGCALPFCFSPPDALAPILRRPPRRRSAVAASWQSLA